MKEHESRESKRRYPGEAGYLLEKLFDTIAARIAASAESPERSVVSYLPIEQLKRELDVAVGAEGGSVDDLLNDIDTYLRYSVDTAHPQFCNQLYGGMNLPAFSGEVIAALTNTSMYTYEVAPVGTLIEMELIDTFNRLIGFPQGEGTFLTGGSNANLIAMFSARNRACPELKRKGLYGIPPLAVFVSEQSHYSFDTAANLLGIGADHVYKIAVDQNGCMDVDALAAAVTRSLARGERPFFTAATAGTTLLGAYDPIEKIAAVTKEHGLWLHVDGAFGGSMILSPKFRRLLRGVEQADSFGVDPHKLMNVPLICSVLLVREKGQLRRNLTELDTSYLFHGNESLLHDLGKQSIQCGRRVDALKLWLAWRFFGDRGYAARMEKLMYLARYARDLVNAHPRLQLMAEPQSVTVCFRYRTRNASEIDAFNRELRDRLRKRGTSLVNYGYLHNELVLRFVAVNPDMETTDVDRFFTNIFAGADQLEGEYSDGRGM